MRARSGCNSVTNTSTPLAYLAVRSSGRPSVAGPHERKTIPVQTVGRGAVLGVRAPPVADGDAVLVVTNAILIFPVEFVDLDLVAVTNRAGIEGFQVPPEHLLHAIDHGLGAEVGRATGRTGDAQRHFPPSSPCREWQKIGQVVVVVHVQEGKEDVVDIRHRNAHGEDVLDAARAEVEEETVAVAEFNHDGRAGLVAPDRDGTTADKRDPHLVRSEGLATGEVVHPAADGRRWLVVGRELQAGARPPSGSSAASVGDTPAAAMPAAAAPMIFNMSRRSMMLGSLFSLLLTYRDLFY